MIGESIGADKVPVGTANSSEVGVEVVEKMGVAAMVDGKNMKH